MKKQTKKSMTSKLDKICSDIIRKNPCAKCGQIQHDKIQCAHIFSRTYRSTRWDLNNLIPLCAGCHFWAHRNPILFTEFVREYLGEEKYRFLKVSHTNISRIRLPEMIELYESLKRIAG